MATLHTARLPSYDRRRTYDWNYEHAPEPAEIDVPPVPGDWRFCGKRVDSPLGIPAGPLLNGRWVLYYASLGFDVLTYKTVRSRERACYPLPNLQPVRCGQLTGGESDLPAVEEMEGSWAVSFGMPSKSPDVWRADIEQTRAKLPSGKLLSVSVVGTVQEGWTIDDLAVDYAQCAKWAVEAGADCVETNFSCPNVSTCDGQLYQDHAGARLVAQRVREAVGSVPFLIKIGHVRQDEDAEQLLDAVGDSSDALAMTNSVATTVLGPDGKLLFGGQRRGVCGEATRDASTQQVEMFARLIARRGDRLCLVGVGGASSADDVRAYVAAGAEAVHIATAAMVRPEVALEIRETLAGQIQQTD
jgi:dihydroorotate dehydrogenase (NAD+) catalytic subunit